MKIQDLKSTLNNNGFFIIEGCELERKNGTAKSEEYASIRYFSTIDTDELGILHKICKKDDTLKYKDYADKFIELAEEETKTGKQLSWILALIDENDISKYNMNNELNNTFIVGITEYIGGKVIVKLGIDDDFGIHYNTEVEPVLEKVVKERIKENM